MINIRETLFPREQWSGCSNHDCIVTGPKKGIGTNGSCHCLMGASRLQLNILKSRIQLLISEQEKETAQSVNDWHDEATKYSQSIAFTRDEINTGKQEAAYMGYMAAKRSQPSVVLPKNYNVPTACYERDIYIKADGWDECIEEFKERLTAAGIKYTIGE